MKKFYKIISFALVCAMVLGSTTAAFAAETEYAEPDNDQYTVVETSVTDVAMPMSQGDSTVFRIGEAGHISNCGHSPKFKCWVTGGTAATKVRFSIVTSGGTSYGPFDPVNADGSNYLDKPYVFVIQGDGEWTFSAYISEGPYVANLKCHVLQYY